MNYSCESFIEFCDQMMIPAEEGLLFGKPSYNQVRNSTKNPIALRMQAVKAKQVCQKKFKELEDNDTILYQFEDWIDDQIRRVQTKINGKK